MSSELHIQKVSHCYFYPCGCHSQLIGDAAKTSDKSISLFGILEPFLYFSKHLKSLTIKKLCERRWESGVNNLQSVWYQYAEVKIPWQVLKLDHLQIIWKFLLCLIICYNILFHVNFASKSMQANRRDLGEATKKMHNF